MDGDGSCEGDGSVGLGELRLILDWRGEGDAMTLLTSALFF